MTSTELLAALERERYGDPRQLQNEAHTPGAVERVAGYVWVTHPPISQALATRNRERLENEMARPPHARPGGPCDCATWHESEAS